MVSYWQCRRHCSVSGGIIGKRSAFAPRPNDKYLTPYSAVVPLLPFLPPRTRFVEPCAGDGRLVRHLTRHGHVCVDYFDIVPNDLFVRQGDALRDDLTGELIITNPPWSRHLLHPMIERFGTCWLLFDADWSHTNQAIELMKHCSHIVPVGRVKWIEDSKHTGKDNCCWYKFDINHTSGATFYPRKKRNRA